MGWDIVIFSSTQKITSVEEIDETLFIPIDFNALLQKHFANIRITEGHATIDGTGFFIEYFAGSKPTSNMMCRLSGETALFEIINVAKIYGWQIFDTGNGEMIDLEHPEKNGYNNFQNYLQQILKGYSTNQNNKR